MIKVERKQTENVKLAEADLRQAKEKKSQYNTENVNLALMEIFHGKCYICESKSITSIQIEHLIPHRGNEDLKYDWNNLFLACAHCNNIKSDKYDPIIDCTKEDVESKIAFRKEGYFGTSEKFVFIPLDDDEKTKNTVELLRDAYYGTTPQKKFEANILRKNLRENISKFKNYVREYVEASGEDREDLELVIKKELGDNSEFAAFKRWLVRDSENLVSLKRYVTVR